MFEVFRRSIGDIKAQGDHLSRSTFASSLVTREAEPGGSVEPRSVGLAVATYQDLIS